MDPCPLKAAGRRDSLQSLGVDWPVWETGTEGTLLPFVCQCIYTVLCIYTVYIYSISTVYIYGIYIHSTVYIFVPLGSKFGVQESKSCQWVRGPYSMRLACMKSVASVFVYYSVLNPKTSVTIKTPARACLANVTQPRKSLGLPSNSDRRPNIRISYGQCLNEHTSSYF